MLYEVITPEDGALVSIRRDIETFSNAKRWFRRVPRLSIGFELRFDDGLPVEQDAWSELYAATSR